MLFKFFMVKCFLYFMVNPAAFLAQKSLQCGISIALNPPEYRPACDSSQSGSLRYSTPAKRHIVPGIQMTKNTKAKVLYPDIIKCCATILSIYIFRKIRGDFARYLRHIHQLTTAAKRHGSHIPGSHAVARIHR